MKQMLLGIFISLFVVLSIDAQAFANDKSYRQLLNDYYLQDKESLLGQDVVDVAQVVISNREDYSQKVVARAFSLLSDVAFNQGDLLAAFQFAQYGIEIEETDAFIQLDLLLKLARGYYAQGKYIQLRDTSQKAAWLAEQAKNMDYHLQALAYSAVAYALSADYPLAITELIKVENLLSQNRQSVDQITLLEIIAEAHFNLAEYEDTIELLDRVLKLRTDMSRTQGIARTYHLVANAYYQLQQYDDAFNTFWQSLQFSQHYELYIRSAYAELGLGQVLFQQQQFIMAKERLLSAQAIFNQHNLVRMKLSAQIALVKVMHALGQKEQADTILLVAQSLAEKLVLSPQQIELYLLLTDYYQRQNEFRLAIKTQKRYLTLYQELYPNVNVKNSLVTAAITSNKVKQLALNLAEKSELSLAFSAKYYRQKIVIILLSIALFCGLVFAVFWRFRLHHQQFNHSYDEVELSKNKVAQPTQTKRWYQQQYKMARKYQYTISVAYLVIENWQELSFHFSAKVLADVNKALAMIMNENIDEEDFAGEISAGEYLFLCPHQTLEQVLSKFTDIDQAIKTRFFANLGDYSVKVRFSVDSPGIQDIDPYVFLSHLSENTEAK